MATESKETKKEATKNWYMKPSHGRLFIKDTLIVGIKYEAKEGKKHAEMFHIPLTDAQVKLFSDKQKEQYLEFR